jgi:hypothetical protein
MGTNVKGRIGEGMSFRNKISRWSISAYKDWQGCPARYKYGRIDKLKPPESPHLERGKKVHSLAEEFVKGNIQGTPKELVSHESHLKTIRDLEFETEVKWIVDHNWEPKIWGDWDNTWLIGVTDAHRYDEAEKHLDIIDYKTGRIYAKNHKDAGEVYALLGHSHYPDLESVSIEYWYLDQGEGETGESPYEYDLDDLDKLLDKWERRAASMLREKKFEARPSQMTCRFCNFRSNRQLADGSYGPCELWQKVL